VVAPEQQRRCDNPQLVQAEHPPLDPPAILTEPVRGSFWGPEAFESGGLEALRRFLNNELPAPPVTRLTGLRPWEVGPGLATASMPASERWQSGAGVFYAGALAFAADMPLGQAVYTTVPPGVGITTSELSINYLRPATIRSQTIVARARLIHSSRTLGLSEAQLEDSRGRLLAHATSRCVITSMAGLPGHPPDEAQDVEETPDPYLREPDGIIYPPEYWNTTPGIDAMPLAGTTPGLRWFGIQVADVREGAVELTMPASAWLGQAFGVVYGGAIAHLADTALICAVGTTVPAATAFNSVDLKVNFLRPVWPGSGDLRARAHIIQRGRTIAVGSCEILDPSGKPAAVASGTAIILPGRSWHSPVHVDEEFPAD
jgi:uncharacterized protein (TIGR00369 family)